MMDSYKCAPTDEESKKMINTWDKVFEEIEDLRKKTKSRSTISQQREKERVCGNYTKAINDDGFSKISHSSKSG